MNMSMNVCLYGKINTIRVCMWLWLFVIFLNFAAVKFKPFCLLCYPNIFIHFTLSWFVSVLQLFLIVDNKVKDTE